MLDGKFSGQGNFIDTDNDIEFNYSGEWLDGNINGLGHLMYDNYIVHFMMWIGPAFMMAKQIAVLLKVKAHSKL